MPEPKELTITIDGPHGYRSWTFTEQQLRDTTREWREVIAEEVNTVVRTEVDRMTH